MSIYDFKVKKRNGEDFSLGQLKGSVLLIVNTATGCGFTPQYEGHKKGLEILDFPCNQFGMQAPGSDDDIHAFCVLKYHTSFDQFQKICVNGSTEDPLYTYLKSFKLDDFGKVINIKWNFEKFLVDRNGNVVGRYTSPTTPEMLEKDIKALL